MKLVTFTIETPKDKDILYPRHCATIVSGLSEHPSLQEIKIKSKNTFVDMRSILGLVSLVPDRGSILTISIICSTYFLFDESLEMYRSLIEEMKIGDILSSSYQDLD